MLHILIVEDDRTIAESITFILEQDSFSCQWFDNGYDALEYVENNAVDLMLLDVGLPDMSGFDVLRKIMKRHYFYDVFIIINLSFIVIKKGSGNFSTSRFAIALNQLHQH